MPINLSSIQSRLVKSLCNLRTVDLAVIVFCIFISIPNIIFHAAVGVWFINLAVNVFVIIIAVVSSNKKSLSPDSIWRQVNYWYLVPLVFIFFKELHTMIEPMRSRIYDDMLILIDRYILRSDPTVELYKIANPYLTELLQIVYGTFFFLPVILGIDLIRQKKFKEFDYSAFIIFFGFCLSFIGYFIVPAIGPRFTLHNFETNNIEMPGILVTNFLREIVNSGESIPSGTLYPAYYVQRDAFPSGHTQMTLLVMILSIKFKSRFKWFFIPNGILLIFATVYLRYHYVTDLIGGFFFMLLTLWSGKYIYKWWETIKATRNSSI